MLNDAQTAVRVVRTRQQFARQRRLAAENFFEQPTARKFLRLADLLHSTSCDEIHKYLGSVAAVGSWA